MTFSNNETILEGSELLKYGSESWQVIERRRLRYVPPKLDGDARIIGNNPPELRVVDFLASGLLLILLFPLMLIIAAVTFISNPGPIFFKQSRIGRYGRMFNCYKFRTMAVAVSYTHLTLPTILRV